MRFVSDEQRKAVMTKLNPGKAMSQRLPPVRRPYRGKGKTVPVGDIKRWLDQAACLLADAEHSEKHRRSPEGIFRQAYPSAEIVIKAARGEHETGKKGHALAAPLRKLAKGHFGEDYLRLPGVAGRVDEAICEITPELIVLAEEVEAFWPPYMNAKHGPVTKVGKDKTLRLARELNRILQPKAVKEGDADVG